MSVAEPGSPWPVLERAIEARLNGRVDDLIEAFADDVEFVIKGLIAGQPMMPVIRGIESTRAFYAGFFSRWDWSAMRLQSRVVEGDLMVLEFSGSVLHRVSGQRFETSCCEILELRAGKIAKVRCYVDTFTFVRISGLAL